MDLVGGEVVKMWKMRKKQVRVMMIRRKGDLVNLVKLGFIVGYEDEYCLPPAI